MELKTAFETVMKRDVNMALATSVEGQPNVRVVTFAQDPINTGTVYFTTFPGNTKIIEFEKNNKVCFLPISAIEEPDMQIRVNGIVKKSEKKVSEVIELLSLKDKKSAEGLKPMMDILLCYQINFSEAQVTIGMNPAEILTI